jgi:hypothetical protein
MYKFGKFAFRWFMLYNCITMHGEKTNYTHTHTHTPLHFFLLRTYTSCLYAPGYVGIEEGGGIAPRTLNLGTKQRWLVNFRPRPFGPQGRDVGSHWTWPQSQSWYFEQGASVSLYVSWSPSAIGYISRDRQTVYRPNHWVLWRIYSVPPSSCQDNVSNCVTIIYVEQTNKCTNFINIIYFSSVNCSYMFRPPCAIIREQVCAFWVAYQDRV